MKFNPADWTYEARFSADEGEIAWYEHVLTGEIIDVEEYESMRNEESIG